MLSINKQTAFLEESNGVSLHWQTKPKSFLEMFWYDADK